MLRREVLIGAAASIIAANAARADGLKTFRPDMWPPMARKADYIAWMVANRGENPEILSQRFDRYEQISGIGDLYTSNEKRAFLLTPREEFALPEDRSRAYIQHYLDIGFGVTMTPPGVVGRMTSAIGVRQGEKVLEIGTGSGYQSALLSYLTPRLYSIEIIPELAARTRGVYQRLIAKAIANMPTSRRATPTATTAGRTPRRSTRSSSPAASTTSRRHCSSNCGPTESWSSPSARPARSMS